jgi:hypothetical protein
LRLLKRGGSHADQPNPRGRRSGARLQPRAPAAVRSRETGRPRLRRLGGN